MPGLQDYLQQRHHQIAISRRQDIGSNFKVPVPATRLERPKSRQSTLSQDVTFAAPSNSAVQGPRQRLNNCSDQAENGHGDGFDTDADSLDDTSTTIGSHKNPILRGHVPQAMGIDPKPHRDDGSKSQARFLPKSWHEQHEKSPRFDHLLAQGALTEGGSESYGETEEGDEGESDGNEEQELTKEPILESDAPGYPESPHEAMELEPQQDTRMHISSIIPMYGLGNVGHPLQTPNDSSPSSVYDHGGDNSLSDADLPRRHQHRAPASMKRDVSLKIQRPDSVPVDPPEKSKASTAFQQNVAEDQLTSQKPRAVPFQVSSLEPASQVAQSAKGSYRPSTKGNSIIESLDAKVPLPAHVKDTAGARDRHEYLHKAIQANDDPETNPVFNGFAGGSNENVTPSVDQGMGSDSVKYSSSDGGGKARNCKRDLDYDPDQLARMRFQQLNKEAFHVDPHGLVATMTPDVASGTLEDKLSYLVRLEDQDARTLQQGAFLSSMPIEEYEECGDIIVERFSDMVKKFKGARRERRQAAEEFEKEVARREECVRGNIRAFEVDLDRLKQSGKDVVRNRLAV